MDKELDDVISCLQEKAENEDDVFDTNVGVKDVESLLVKLKTRKAVGPDSICARFLKSCTFQLCHVLSILFFMVFEGLLCAKSVENLCDMSCQKITSQLL